MQAETQRYDDAYWDWVIHAAERVREYLEFAADYMPCIRDAIRQAQKAEARSTQKDKIAELEEKIGEIPPQLKQSMNCLEELSQSLRQLQGSIPCSEDEAWEQGNEMEALGRFAVTVERQKNKAWKPPCRPAEVLGCAPRTKTDSIHLRAARRSKRLTRSDMTGAGPELKTKEE